jgi:hypothetical protein
MNWRQELTDALGEHMRPGEYTQGSTTEDDAASLIDGESPLRPLFRLIGETAIVNTSGEDVCVELGDTTDPMEWLRREGIVGPLALACLAIAEVAS